jgi:hypothetical protein
MTTLLRDKCSLERDLGCPVEFRRDTVDNLVEIHATNEQTVEHDWHDYTTTWLGRGETLADAICDAQETLRVRRKHEVRMGRGDYERDLRKDEHHG